MQPESAMTPGLEVTVLVSVGRHPLTGRARRADQDARGVELARSFADAQVRLLHAGMRDESSEAALRGYLGMGFTELSLLEQPQGADVLPALAEALDATSPHLVITGERAERGEGSGLLPYLLAERLGWPLVSGLAAVESVEDGVATLLQALPRGSGGDSRSACLPSSLSMMRPPRRVRAPTGRRDAARSKRRQGR